MPEISQEELDRLRALDAPAPAPAGPAERNPDGTVRQVKPASELDDPSHLVFLANGSTIEGSQIGTHHSQDGYLIPVAAVAPKPVREIP